MTSKSSSRLKLIRLIEILEQKTDENHVYNASELCEELEKCGITAERKSIYRDIALLNENGYDIYYTHVPKTGYFMASRDFELAEVRLILDAVQSADFITAKKTKALVEKIGRLASEGQFNAIKNQVFISNRIKCKNEEIYYTIDVLNEAIQKNKQVSFVYLKRKIEGGRKIIWEEKEFIVNPYALVWSNDHYYLVCNNPKYVNLMHTRLDRMKRAKITEQDARSFEEVSDYRGVFDAADYVNKMFNMYSGKLEKIELVCNNSILEDIVDRFGDDACIRTEDMNRFLLRSEVAISEGFISWLMQYRNNVFVRKPEFLRDVLMKQAQNIVNLYS